MRLIVAPRMAAGFLLLQSYFLILKHQGPISKGFDMLLTSCRGLSRPLGHRNWLSSTTSFPCGQITDAKRDTVRFEYLPGELRHRRNPFKHTPIAQTVFKRLRDCRILRTFCGCRAGRALKLRSLLGSSNI